MENEKLFITKKNIIKRNISIPFKNKKSFLFHINKFDFMLKDKLLAHSSLILMHIIILFLSINSINNIILKQLNYDNIIKLTIKGSGDQPIISNDYNYFKSDPDKILINEIQQDQTKIGKIAYDLTGETNNITLIWDNQIDYCSYMFQGLTNIIEIDFSDFNSSIVTQAAFMFNGCSSLTSINFKNFLTFNIISMYAMFESCISLTSIDLSNFDTSSVTNMERMFYGCKSLNNLDLSKFITSKASSLAWMFDTCESLVSLNLTNFNTSLVNNLAYMFRGTIRLKSLNLDNFDTSLVTNMNGMFCNCTSLVSLSLKNFNLPNINDIGIMFQNCKSLITLDFSSFTNTAPHNMYSMFQGCESLISLDISSFDMSSVTNINYLFSDCKSLISLNIMNFANFDNSVTTESSFMFFNCDESLRYCINKEITLSTIKTQLDAFQNFNCSDDCFVKSANKFILEKKICIDNCNNDDYYQSEYNSICYHSCPDGTHKSKDNDNLCEEDIICENYYSFDLTECIDSIPLGYYLNDTDKRTIDKCNIKCLNCSLESNINNLCISCNTNEGYHQKDIDNSNDNLFIDCEKEIPNNTNGLIISIPISTSLMDESNRDREDIRDINYHINKFLNNSDINSNYSFYYYEININENGLENKYFNSTFIEFPPETINALKNNFGLDLNNDKIYVLITEYLQNDLNSAVKDFDYKIFLENGTLLNINEDIYVEVYLPLVDLNSARYNYSVYFSEQGYDIYNKNDKFYNDKCTPAYLNDNDITIKDRRNDIYPNLTLCQENCNYKGFNIEEKRIICDCNINVNKNYTKKNDNFLEEDNGNFFNYFLDNINYEILKCYILLISFENLRKNFAFYFTFLFILVIISINILFWLYEISKIKKIIDEQFPNLEKVYKDYAREIRKFKKYNNELLTFKQSKESLLFPSKKKKKKHKTGRESIGNKRNLEKKKTTQPLNIKELEILSSSNIKKDLNVVNIGEEKMTEYIEPIKENCDFNELTFRQALREDKRNILIIFKSIIMEKLELVNLISGRHKAKIILIYHYIFSLLIDLFLNAFLYTDDVVSNKYHNNGELDLIVSLTLSLLSNIINSIICYFLNFSKGIEERLEQIMQIKKEDCYFYSSNKFMKILKVKIMLYFIIDALFTVFAFYYIIIFCILYNNSQISFLTNYLMSIIESLIMSIIVSISIVVTRIIGIKFSNKKMYNISKYLNNTF